MLIDMFGVHGTLMVPTTTTTATTMTTATATAAPCPDASPALPDEAELFQRIFGDPPPR
ncbi:hypothetical protein ABTZ59_11520 [Streptomyces sp. NPDC094034]|uniref:hypothetical protein n=1 Tax=Streptomyces sp. NPDC094034 TaxID=3155309 RepID=UPI003319771A